MREVVHSECNIIFGATIDENIKDEVQVTVIATGFDMPHHVEQPATPKIETNVAGFNAFASTPINTQPIEEPKQEEMSEPEVEPEQPKPMVEDISFNSKVDLGDTSIPPFLRKLKK